MRRFLVILGAWLGFVTASHADVVVQTASLKNGLTLALIERPGPVAAVQLWVRAGSQYEPATKRGTARLLEYLLTAGSAHVRPGTHAKMLAGAGGSSSVLVTQDATVLLNEVPQSHVEFAIELESDRLSHAIFSEATLADAKRQLAEQLAEQNRQPVWNVLRGLLPRVFAGTPYAWDANGYNEDLTGISLGDVRRFYVSRMVPQRTLLVVVGDVKFAQLRTVAERVFTAEGAAETEKAWELPVVTPSRTVGNAGSVGAVFAAVRLPPAHSNDVAAANIALTVLAGGEGSRLASALSERVPGAQINVVPYWLARGGLAMIYATFGTSAQQPVVEAALAEEFTRLAKAPISAIELTRARTRLRALAAEQLTNPTGLAFNIGQAWIATGDPSVGLGELGRLAKTTAVDVTRVAASYFAEASISSTILPVQEAQ